MCKSKLKGGRRCPTAVSKSIANLLIPRRGGLNAYYKATDAKHMRQAGASEGPGSVFTDSTLKNLNDVVALAARQRDMSLDGDDREELVTMGASREAFKPGVRYLIVRTTGTVGVKQSAGMPDETPISIVRSKPGASATPVLDVTEKPTTNVATIIIGKHPKDPNREVVFTAHPGMPTPSDGQDRLGHLEGQQTTLGEVRRIYGHEVWLNTRLTTPVV